MATVRDMVNEARRRDRELGPYLLMGIRESRRLGFRAMGRVLSAYRRGGGVRGVFGRIIRPLEPLLRDMMVAAHIVGALQVYRSAPGSMALAGAPFARAVQILRRRSQLEPAAFNALQARYGVEAARVVKGATDATERKIQSAMWRIQSKGMHVREGVVELQKAFDASGMTATASHTLEAIFRTQTQIASSAGQYQAARDPDVDEILWGWRYVAIGDERTRPEHAALDGTTLPKNDPRWGEIFPPNGYNCRCTAVEIFDKAPRGGIREPPATVTVGDRTIPVKPDKGFAWNPGMVYKEIGGE